MIPSPAIWIAAGAIAAGAAGVGLGVAVVDGEEGGSPPTPLAVVDDAPPTTVTDETNGGDGDGGEAPGADEETTDVVSITLPDELVTAIMFECPGRSPSGSLHSGDRVVATAVDPSGSWVAVRNPLSIRERVWVSRSLVVPDGGFDGLPIEPCVPPPAGAVPDSTTTTVPESTTTVVDGSTTVPASTTPGPVTTPTTQAPTGPTSPPATQPPSGPSTTTGPPPSTSPPATTPPTTAPPNATTTTTSTTTTSTTTSPPDTSGPTLSATRDPGQIWDDFPATCSGLPKSSTISASASDPSGVASITASWNFGGGGSANLLTGPKQFGPFDYPAAPANGQQNVSILIVATDTLGNASQTSVSVTVTSADTCIG